MLDLDLNHWFHIAIMDTTVYRESLTSLKFDEFPLKTF